MRIAVIGSRSAIMEDYNLISENIPKNASEIVSGGASGVDALAKFYAKKNNLRLTEFLPDYNNPNLENKKMAPLLRNRQIVDYADFILAFWDGVSNGTKFTVDYANKKGKPVKIVMLKKD